VTRGKWVLDNVLGEPPAPPPAGVDTMGELPSQPANILLRDPSCAQCHVKMDPIGYALENFDGAGQWRQTDHANAAIVPIGFLPDGQKMDGPAGLKAYLAQHRGAYVRVLSENLLSYSQGRRLKDWERQSLADIAEMVEPSSYSFSSLILEVVRSAPFQMGQREPEVAGKSN
jgi:hypothetical protein